MVKSDRRAWQIAAVMLLLYLISASLTSLWDRDEPRFARAAVEMVASGDYLVPTFNGDLRADKPPLIYWLMSVFLHLLGTGALAVRLPSVLAMVATALIVYRIGKLVAGEDVGVRGMVIFATMPLPFFIGNAATADSALLLGVTAAIWAFSERVLAGKSWWQMPILAAALCWALLAKGPVGLAIPLLTIITTSILLGRHGRPDRRFWALLNGAVIVAVGVFLSWGLPANEATGGELARIGLGRHLIDRATGALEGHGISGWLGYLGLLPFYLPVLFVASGGWSFLLIPALGTFRSSDRPQRALLVGWIVPTFVMMSLVATKLPHYILGIMPAVAIALALASKKRSPPRRSFSVLLGTAAFALFLVGLPVFLVLKIDGFVALAAVALSVVVAALALPVVFAGSEGQPVDQRSFARLGIAGAILLSGISLLLMQTEEQLKIDDKVTKAIEEAGMTDIPIACHRFFEPSLVFSLDRRAAKGVATVAKVGGDLKGWARQEGPSLLLTTGEALAAEGVQSLEELGLEPIAGEGWPVLNLSTGERVTVLLGLRR